MPSYKKEKYRWSFWQNHSRVFKCNTWVIYKSGTTTNWKKTKLTFVTMSSMILSTDMSLANNSVTLLTRSAKTQNGRQGFKPINYHSIARLGSAAQFPNVIMIRGPAASGDKLRLEEVRILVTWRQSIAMIGKSLNLKNMYLIKTRFTSYQWFWWKLRSLMILHFFSSSQGHNTVCVETWECNHQCMIW